MRLQRLVARGFRNLEDVACQLPPAGVILLGANGQGKTNLLEAAYYPVLFRSFRGAADQEVLRFGAAGFRIEAEVADEHRVRVVAATYLRGARRKRIWVDGDDAQRLADAAGTWLAVAFLPSDVGLAGGPAIERRQYLDRMLALAHRGYLEALTRYRAALAQRNSALRQGRPDVARAFDGVFAAAGAVVVRQRLEWIGPASEQFATELEWLGETEPARLRYLGRPELADETAWPPALEEARGRDRARGASTVGPHRDDIVLEIGGRPLRVFGSAGQQRSAAVALKLIEITTLRRCRGTEPALLLDDVFAELDRERQVRLATRLLDPEARQVVLTAPRRDELPEPLPLPVWQVEGGRLKT